jgi:hypothetical protein
MVLTRHDPLGMSVVGSLVMVMPTEYMTEVKLECQKRAWRQGFFKMGRKADRKKRCMDEDIVQGLQ